MAGAAQGQEVLGAGGVCESPELCLNSSILEPRCQRACTARLHGSFLLVLRMSLQIYRVSLLVGFLGLGYLSGEHPVPVCCFRTLSVPGEMSANLDLG